MKIITMVLAILLSACKAEKREIVGRNNKCDNHGGVVEIINATGQPGMYILLCKDGSVWWERA